MDTDRNRQSQQDRSGNSDDEAVVDHITVTYDLSPTEAREIISVCGCNDRLKNDNYMSD